MLFLRSDRNVTNVLIEQVHVAFFHKIHRILCVLVGDVAFLFVISFTHFKYIHIIQNAYRFLVKMNTFNISNEREQLGLNVLRIQITLSNAFTRFRNPNQVRGCCCLNVTKGNGTEKKQEKEREQTNEKKTEAIENAKML